MSLLEHLDNVEISVELWPKWKKESCKAVLIPEQSIIDSWPQLQRNPTLNADEQKYLEEAIKAERWVP